MVALPSICQALIFTPGIRQHTTTPIAIGEVFNSIWDCMQHPGNEPGLGVALDHDRAARYPYRRACLPVNRLEDGSMFDW
jgi:mannonate dehydratase